MTFTFRLNVYLLNLWLCNQIFQKFQSFQSFYFHPHMHILKKKKAKEKKIIRVCSTPLLYRFKNEKKYKTKQKKNIFFSFKKRLSRFGNLKLFF